MKKFLILAISMICFLEIGAQDRSMNGGVAVAFSQDQSYYKYTGISTDAINTTYDSLGMIFTMNKSRPTRYDFKVRVDTVHLGARYSGIYSAKLQGRKFTTDTWTDITTVTSTHQTKDSSIYFSYNVEPSSSATLLYDTTLHTTTYWKGANPLLYSATLTTTGSATSKYWYQYRILLIWSAGSEKVEYIETKFWF